MCHPKRSLEERCRAMYFDSGKNRQADAYN